MREISWSTAKTGQLLKKDSAPWSKYIDYRIVHSLVLPEIRKIVRDRINNVRNNFELLNLNIQLLCKKSTQLSVIILCNMFRPFKLSPG
jgi:hypothetical protein